MDDLRRRQGALGALRWAGRIASVAGALAVAVGAVLPWARFSVFGVEITQPGVLGLGALSLSGALLALLWGRRLPLLGLLLGLFALGIGAHAERETGRTIKGRILQLQMALAPVNDKLMRVGLPPVEPFPLGTPWKDFVGPGPRWTFWGGAALMIGSAAVFAGGRLLRSCPHCGARWSAARAVAFCPACGKRVGPLTACPACESPLEPNDRYCGACGANVARDLSLPEASAPRPARDR